MFSNSFQWDERSKVQRATLVAPLRLVMDDAMRLSDVPFQQVQGARTIEEQSKLFLEGKSKVNPASYPNKADLYKNAKHVVGPGEPLSRAVDIVCRTPGRAYDERHMCYIAGVVMACARIRGVRIRWGGNWDRDTEIVTDQIFDDLPHFEID